MSCHVMSWPAVQQLCIGVNFTDDEQLAEQGVAVLQCAHDNSPVDAVKPVMLWDNHACCCQQEMCYV